MKNDRKEYLYGIILILLSVLQACTYSDSGSNRNKDTGSSVNSQDSTDQQMVHSGPLEILKKTYPDFFEKCDVKGDSIVLGNEMIVFDDRKNKDFISLLDNADIEDMFAMEYSDSITPGYLMDAGRSRCERLFKIMYGADEQQVKKNLVKVDWFGQNIWFNSINGAADSLRMVAKELANRTDLNDYLKSSGTFYWRKVRGANRLSAHSYGIAIDIGVAHSNYWLWDNPKASELDRIKYNNRMPLSLVEIFERHGFIWGGRWYHYDTMHFEFRPEILEYSRTFTSS